MSSVSLEESKKINRFRTTLKNQISENNVLKQQLLVYQKQNQELQTYNNKLLTMNAQFNETIEDLTLQLQFLQSQLPKESQPEDESKNSVSTEPLSDALNLTQNSVEPLPQSSIQNSVETLPQTSTQNTETRKSSWWFW